MVEVPIFEHALAWGTLHWTTNKECSKYRQLGEVLCLLQPIVNRVTIYIICIVEVLHCTFVLTHPIQKVLPKSLFLFIRLFDITVQLPFFKIELSCLHNYLGSERITITPECSSYLYIFTKQTGSSFAKGWVDKEAKKEHMGFLFTPPFLYNSNKRTPLDISLHIIISSQA